MADYRIPPQDIDAEKSLLGALLIDEDAFVKIADNLQSEHFYDPKHASVYQAIRELFDANKSIDALTLSNHLKKKKILKKIGGAAYLADLVASVPTSAHIEEYANIVRETGIRRGLIRLGAEYNDLAFNEEDELDIILDHAEQKIFNLTQKNFQKGFIHISKLLEEAYERAENIDKQKDKVLGVKTGFRGLDSILGGFQDSNLIILAARPAVGKTALSLDFARHASINLNKKVGFFSLEMSNTELMDRLLAMEIGASLWELRMGKLPDSAFDRLADAMGRLSESGLYIDDTAGLSIMEMRTKARKMKMEFGLDLIIVDYLQLIQGRNKENRTQEVSEISRFLKIMAKDLGIPVIALSQLSRAVENRGDRIPQLSDLRESGSIEQDADVVMFIHRDKIEQGSQQDSTTQLIIAKHRNGPTGFVELFFVKEQARFREIEQRDMGEVELPDEETA